MIDQRENICYCLFVLANNIPTRRESCPGDGERLHFRNESAVRCCEVDGDRCFTPNDCPTTKSYEIAEQTCSSLSMRLCTPSEMADGLCCGTGCDVNFGNRLNWQGKYSSLSKKHAGWNKTFKLENLAKFGNSKYQNCVAWSRDAWFLFIIKHK